MLLIPYFHILVYNGFVAPQVGSTFSKLLIPCFHIPVYNGFVGRVLPPSGLAANCAPGSYSGSRDFVRRGLLLIKAPKQSTSSLETASFVQEFWPRICSECRLLSEQSLLCLVTLVSNLTADHQLAQL